MVSGQAQTVTEYPESLPADRRIALSAGRTASWTEQRKVAARAGAAKASA